MKSKGRGDSLIVCFLYLSAVQVSTSGATSNVHSIWLDASHLSSSSPRPDPTGNSQRVFSQRTGLWSVLPSSLAAQDTLTNSASSLQPAIATPQSDQDETNKRFDLEPTVTYVNSSRQDSATTSDSWSHPRGTNVTNNGQVQFDEDVAHKSPKARSSSSLSSNDKPTNEQDDLISTEVYNNTNPASHFHHQSSAVGFEDFVRVLPSSQDNPHHHSASTEAQDNHTSPGIKPHTNRSSAATDSPTSFIYYLTEGDRWNRHQGVNNHRQPEDDLTQNQLTSHNLLPPPINDHHLLQPSTNLPADFGSSDRRWSPQQPASTTITADNIIAPTSGSRRKLHNSGTQYDLRNPTNELINLAGERTELHVPETRRIVQQNREPNRNLIQFVTDRVITQSYRPDLQPFQATTPVPRSPMQLSRVPATNSRPSTMVRTSVRPNPLEGPLLVQHPSHRAAGLQYYYRPSAYRTAMTTNSFQRRPAQQERSKRPHPSWRQKAIRATSSSNRLSWLEQPQAAQRSFLQSYDSSFGGYRPKLKPLAMLTNWMSEAGSQQLDNAFYSTGSADRSRRLPIWNGANYHQYNYKLPASAATSSAAFGQQQPGQYWLLIQPTVGGGTNFARQHYQRPTPAPASLNYAINRPQNHDLAQHHSTSRNIKAQQAGFIPVVAVSVTKTSPLPMPAAHSNQLTEVSAEQPDTDLAPDYQPQSALVTKRDHQQAKVHFDDYGNYASGSSGNAATHVGNQQRVAYHQPAVETTTVKSALFGYLPHEVERPLMNIFSPIHQQLMADSNRATSLYQQQTSAADHNPQLSDLQQQQLSNLAHHQPLEEPPTPLGLQLQANSYVQNDIAHPFGTSGTIQESADQRAPLYFVDGGSATDQQTGDNSHHLPIVQSHQNLMNSLLADDSFRSPHLLAVASELNPLMPVVLNAAAHQEETSNESSGGQKAESHQVEPSRGSSPLNNKGNKKRSSDFFASAGQLLLSALPLLLAPTLGLMFASSPGAVARYQGAQNTFSGADPSLINAGSMPSSYISGLNHQGVVSNASPAPLLFTPSPPTMASRLNSSISHLAASSSPSSQTTPTESPAATTSSTLEMNKRQQRPTLGPVQTLASWTGSTPPPPLRNYSIIHLNTSTTPASEAANRSRTSSSAPGHGNAHHVDHTNGQNSSSPSAFDHHSTHTIVLIHPDRDESGADSLRKSDNSTLEKDKIHYDIGGYEGVDFDAQFPSLKKTTGPRIQQATTTLADNHQDGPADRTRYHYSQVSSNAPDTTQQRQRHDYKPLSNKTAISGYDDHSDMDDELKRGGEDNLKLFPVSRWPTMHRRTVSLVTSTGNKTMPDSSDKYSFDLDASSASGQSARANQRDDGYRTLSKRTQQVEAARRLKRDLISSNEIISHTNLTLKDGKKLVKIVKKRLSKKPEESQKNVGSSNGNRNSTSDPLISDSSSGRAKFEVDQEARQVDDHRRADYRPESARIIATMVAQMNNHPEDGFENEGDRQDMIEHELRDQLLRKKVMLDKLASKSMGELSAQLETKQHQVAKRRRRRPPINEPELEEDEEMEREPILNKDRDLSAGGRGYLEKSAPIEVISTRIKLRKRTNNEGGLSRPLHYKTDVEEEEAANLVLNDDTRKALTKFGNLLIKDTLHIPNELSRQERRRVGDLSKRANWKHHKSAIVGKVPIEQEDESISSATERTFSRTNPYPDQMMSRSQPYRQEPNSSYSAYPYSSHAGSGQPVNYSISGAQGYLAPSIQEQVNLLPEPHDHIGGGYGSPDDRRNEYSASMNLLPSRYAQPDRYNRVPEFNYSREPPPNHSNYSNSYYSRPISREPPRSHHYNDDRGHPLYQSASYPANDTSSYPPLPLPPPPPNHRPSDDYYDVARRDSYQSPYHGPDQGQRYSNSNNYHNRYPADPRFPAASQEHETWPHPRSAASNQEQQDQAHHHHHHPASRYSGYSPTQAIDTGTQQQQAGVSGPPMSRSIAGDSSAVNEYLKRVQFSDSDRDKLMASYLTCDGLLNDNDHCLERLSCEFSDPQNIERANKLDRAVSSILLGHILINTYIPNQFKLRLKSASLFGYTHSGNCSKYVCNKLAKSSSVNSSV